MTNKNNKDFIDINISDFNYDSSEIKSLMDTKLPDPDTLSFYNQIFKREIFINNDIDEYCANYSKMIFDWNLEDRGIPIEERKRIKIFLHTDGGDVPSMNSLISAIILSKTPIITIGLGKVYSAGAMILISADSDKRLLLPNSRVMIHKGSSGIISDVNKIINYSKFLEKDNELTKQYILQRTNISPEKYKEVEDKDWYILPSECVEFGVASRIIEDIDELA